MHIKQITIEGELGEVEIRRTEEGAVVSANEVEVLVRRIDSEEERFAAAYGAAEVIFGADKCDKPLATNSMIDDVFGLIERVVDA